MKYALLLASLLLAGCDPAIPESSGTPAIELKPATPIVVAAESNAAAPPITELWGKAIELTWVGRVIKVTDGDTVTVLKVDNTKVRVRLAGIDAPEKKQPFGTKAKQALADMVHGKEVVIAQMGIDRYERVLGHVLASHGTQNANSEMLRLGLAWHYKKYNKSSVPAELEDQARKQGLGLWAGKSDQDQIPPWEWRRR